MLNINVWRDSMRRFTLCSCVFLSLSSLLLSSNDAYAERSSDGIWSDVAKSRLQTQGKPDINAAHYRLVSLNVSALQNVLRSTPLEARGIDQASKPVVLTLPLPDGSFGRFQIVESSVMEPELAARYPAIKTFSGQGIDDPTATVRFDSTPAGFHAMILTAGDTIYVDPFNRTDTEHYISYYKRDFKVPEGKFFKEGMPIEETPSEYEAELQRQIAGKAPVFAAKPSGAELRTYRLAVAAEGEYTAKFGGTKAGALAAIVTTVNRVVGIFEREIAVSLVLINNNDAVIYTDAATDPYTSGNSAKLLDENQANLDQVIGSANYDIGHVVGIGQGGLAQRGSVCSSSKAQGLTALDNPVGDPFDVDFVAHEIGHQFGADHTYNANAGGSCTTREPTTAFEPASGSTIMGYAGICSDDTADVNLQQNADPYFHTASFDQIITYTTTGEGNSCGVKTTTSNAPPVVNAGQPNGLTIPKQTPFTLTGSATDPNGDALTYSWEEFDLGNPSPGRDNTNPPFFRSFPPTASPSRTFPKWSDIINNTTTYGEILPNVTRAMVFRLTARDNKAGGGGVDYDSARINVTADAGPFVVTAPNTAVSWNGNSAQTVTWDVANTNAAPVNCANVNILLSTDGGQTYPLTLASSVPNNGTANVTAPNTATTSARVQVACAGNIFFDISNANFTITQADSVPSVTINQAPGQADPSSAGPVNFTATFSEAVTGFTASDLSFAGSTAAGTLTATVTGGPSAYNVAVNGMTGSGTVVASIPAQAANNAGGLASQASTSTDNTVTFNFAPPAPSADVALTLEGYSLRKHLQVRAFITNPGSLPAYKVNFTMVLPVGVSLSRVSGRGTSCVYRAKTRTLTCKKRKLVTGGFGSINLFLVPRTNSTIEITGNVTTTSAEKNTGNNTASVIFQN